MPTDQRQYEKLVAIYIIHRHESFPLKTERVIVKTYFILIFLNCVQDEKINILVEKHISKAKVCYYNKYLAEKQKIYERTKPTD